MWFFIILGIAFVIFGIILTINQNKIVGISGEFHVKGELAKLPNDYLVLNDVMVKGDRGTTQIDHVVISKYGIFVIETKQINGTIYGNDYDKNWTIYYGKEKHSMYNPTHQNWGHVQALKKVLDLDEKKFIPIVCIPSQAKVKVKSNKVVPIYELIGKIRNYKQEILPEYEDIYKTLEFLNMTSTDSREAHVDRVKEIKNEIK